MKPLGSGAGIGLSFEEEIFPQGFSEYGVRGHVAAGLEKGYFNIRREVLRLTYNRFPGGDAWCIFFSSSQREIPTPMPTPKRSLEEPG
jgi:hypothetical protein